MDKERDLLPWILGGVLLTTVATAVDLVANAQPAVTPPPAAINVVAAPAPAAASAAAVTSVPPANQIWECNNGGRRVFADSPCGAHASLRELSPMNTMVAPNPVTVYYPSPSSTYPAPRPAYREEPDAAYEQSESQQLDAVYYYNGVARHRRPARHGDHVRGPRGYRR